MQSKPRKWRNEEEKWPGRRREPHLGLAEVTEGAIRAHGDLKGKC
jgi:hypothetical protein